MTQRQSLFKRALLEELSNGRYRLLATESPAAPVSDIEFNNRKAARNWARSRGFIVAIDGTPIVSRHGDN